MAEPIQKNRTYFASLIGGRRNFDKEVVCKWCKTPIITLSKYYKKDCEQSKAFVEYCDHWKTCEIANEELYESVNKKAKEDKLGRGYTNCPCCGETMRTDNLVRHVASKHAYDCLLSMPITKRKEISNVWKVPIFFGNIPSKTEDGGCKTVLYVCAGCKKGALCTGHKNGMLMNINKIKTEHTACSAQFEKYASYYDDETPVEYLPFLAKSFSNKVATNETVGSTEPPTAAPAQATAPTNEIVGSTECAKCSTATVVSDEDPFRKAFIQQALAVLKVSDVKKGIAELEYLNNLIMAIRKMNRDDDENDSFEDMKESIESVEKRITEAARVARINGDQKIAALKKQLEEKEAVSEVYETLRFGMAGRTDDSEY